MSWLCSRFKPSWFIQDATTYLSRLANVTFLPCHHLLTKTQKLHNTTEEITPPHSFRVKSLMIWSQTLTSSFWHINCIQMQLICKSLFQNGTKSPNLHNLKKRKKKRKKKNPQRGGNIYARTFLSMWTDSISVNYFEQVFWDVYVMMNKNLSRP